TRSGGLPFSSSRLSTLTNKEGRLQSRTGLCKRRRHRPRSRDYCVHIISLEECLEVRGPVVQTLVLGRRRNRRESHIIISVNGLTDKNSPRFCRSNRQRTLGPER